MKYIWAITVLSLAIQIVKPDLPVHCLTSQVKGPWSFVFSDADKENSPLENSCGHDIPDTENTSLLSLKKFKFKDDDEKLYINLNKDGSVTVVEKNYPPRFAAFRTSSSKGFWSMVYDEGFEVRKGDISLFLFSQYYPDKTSNANFESNCAKTLTGWFNNRRTKEYGCVKGQRTDTDAIINKQQNKTYVVEGKVEEKKVFSTQGAIDRKILLSSSILFRFSQAYKTRLNLHAGFTNHELVAKRLNMIQSDWVAGVNPVFAGLNISQINKLMGRKRSHKTTRILEPRFIEKAAEEKGHATDIKDLPKNFAWEKEIPEPVSQGDCGSCFAISAMQMVSARVKIKFDQKVNLSPQFVMDCSYYNQGCDGGYPYLVGRFGKELHYVEEKCKPYKKADGKCSSVCDYSKAPFLVKAKEYKYVGGRYGYTDEHAILKEVHDHGPIVVDFTPDYSFSMYKDGIYKSPDQKKLFMVSELRPEWTQVDHAVLLYGWGETEKGEKYWLLQNSWGDDWGKKGRFKMARGYNEMGIESSGEAIEPDLIAGEAVADEASKLTRALKKLKI